ncbi:MAG: hypothetical protein AAFX99_23225 [Myxococcota bacterium]
MMNTSTYARMSLLCAAAALCISCDGLRDAPMDPFDVASFSCSEADLNALQDYLMEPCRSYGARLGRTELAYTKLMPGDLSMKAAVDTILVMVTAKSISIDGFYVHSKSALDERIRQAKFKLKQNNRFRHKKDEPLEIALAVAPNVRLERLNTLMKAIVDAGIQTVHFLFEGEPSSMEGLDPTALKEIEELQKAGDPHKEELVKYFGQAIGRCMPLHEMFSSLAVATPDTRCELAAQGMAIGIQKCNCGWRSLFMKADFGRSVTALRLMNSTRTFVSTKVMFGPGEELKLKPEMTWAQAAPLVKASADKTVVPFW